MLAIAECSEGSTTAAPPTTPPRWWWCIAGDEGREGTPGDAVGDGSIAVPAGGDAEPGAESDASEWRERALLLRYTPLGTVIVFRRGSESTVGIEGRSAYVKYAVRCHLRGRAFGAGVTYAEYACFTSPVGWWSLRS